RKKYTVAAMDKLDGNTRIYVHFPFEDFLEGENNVIQFRSKDIAGNGKSEDYPGFTLSPLFKVLVNTIPTAVITSPVEGEEFMLGELITFDGSGSFDSDKDSDLRFQWDQVVGNGTKILGDGMILENKRFQTIGTIRIVLYVGDSIHRYNELTGEDRRAVTYVNIIIKAILVPPKGTDDDYMGEGNPRGDGMDDNWEWLHQLNWERDDSDEDPDNDGYTNYDEYLGIDKLYRWDQDDNDDTDPRNPRDRPSTFGEVPGDVVKEAPFQIWVYLLVLMVAIIITALIVLIGYMRAHKGEEGEEREEAEEEAMLATPQIEIPSMPMGPAGVPMVDTSTPALPAPEGAAPGPQPAEPMSAQPMQ
ncbi:MAG: hypothetical protein KAH57_10900, partial [Thermoplasmata archaeon]|nr:hypothetical protein [Thermoplasmata archaeon]